MELRRQWMPYGVLLGVLCLSVFVTFITGLHVEMAKLAPKAAKAPLSTLPHWQLAFLNTGLSLLLYGALGLAGLWFAKKLSLPGVYRPGAGLGAWLWKPMFAGLGVGVVLVLGDRLFAWWGQSKGFPHPSFPLSLLASITAGIGEELLFRAFVMGLWAYLLHLLLRRWHKERLGLWIANVIAALAFGAGHLPAAMLLAGVATPDKIPPLILVALFSLNGILGLVAGERYMRDGLIAAVGVHFWADIVWHILWPLLGRL